MAEAFLRRYDNGQFEVHSAGLAPKGVNPLTIKVMKEAGIDISGHSSKGIETYLGKTLFQTLITVCDDADKNCPTVWPGVNTRLHWSFEDPATFEGTEEEKLAKFREVRDQIEIRVKEWVAGQS
jgi:arsenate reductase